MSYLKSYAWGVNSRAIELARGAHFSLKKELIASEDFEPWHFHKKTTQLFHVHKGILEVKTPIKSQQLKRGEVLVIEPYLAHMVANNSTNPVELNLYSSFNVNKDRFTLDYPYPPIQIQGNTLFEILEQNRFKRYVKISLTLLHLTDEQIKQILEWLIIKHFVRELEVECSNETQRNQLQKFGFSFSSTSGRLLAKQWMLKNPLVQIVSHSEAYGKAFAQLNTAWIKKYFDLEEHDLEVLRNPQKHILHEGGLIYYVLYKNKPVSTVALFKNKFKEWEITKMATQIEFQGTGLGELLLKHCIAAARAQKIQTLVLYTQSSLFPAIRLYKRLGFAYSALQVKYYTRADVKMQLKVY